jgi:hypothetical protein
MTIREASEKFAARMEEHKAEAVAKGWGHHRCYYAYEQYDLFRSIAKAGGAEEYEVSVGKGHKVTVLSLAGEVVSVTVRSKWSVDGWDCRDFVRLPGGGKACDAVLTVLATCRVTGGRKAETLQALGQTTHRCAICGAWLTDPDSMARGIGPECIRHLGVDFADRVEVAQWKARKAQKAFAL